MKTLIPALSEKKQLPFCKKNYSDLLFFLFDQQGNLHRIQKDKCKKEKVLF
jgi:hypothetical protein